LPAILEMVPTNLPDAGGECKVTYSTKYGLGDVSGFPLVYTERVGEVAPVILFCLPLRSAEKVGVRGVKPVLQLRFGCRSFPGKTAR